jgi:[acyl-carrier-protein] S-malonyltransferase
MIAFVFPGQGSQQVGMGKSLASMFPICRETLEYADFVLGESLSSLCFDGPDDALMLTENTQPAILAVSVAVYRLLVSRGISPDFLAGHSLGEYSAHVAAGTLSFADTLRTVRRRGRYMQEAVPVGKGAMTAILGIDEKTVSRACNDVSSGDVVSPANLNAPGQVVIAGEIEAVKRAGVRSKELGARKVLPLPVSAPFHCSLMMPAQERLEPELRSLVASDPKIPVVANVDAEPKRTAASAIDALVRQISAPVLWEGVVRKLASSGVDLYIEVGPGKILSSLIKKIDRKAKIANVGNPEEVAELEAMLKTLVFR